jgi:hypothetical protein
VISVDAAPACFDTWRVVIIVLGITMSEQRQSSRLSDRALAIVAGLVQSKKVAPMVPGSANMARGFMRLDRVGAEGIFYWIALDGSTLKRGRDLAEADDLAPGFVQSMERLGQPRRGLDVPPAPVKSCLAGMA